MRSVRLLLIIALLSGSRLLVGCGRNDGSSDLEADEKRSVIVGAAASLRDVFNAVKIEFEKEHPGVSVRFNYAASNLLARQAEQGAPFDVIAFAAKGPMDGLDSAGLLQSGSRTTFARNRLCVVVGNALKERPMLLSDLSDPAYARIAVGSPGVPVRTYTEEALRKTGLWSKLEPRFVYGANVRQVLDYVETGEADCGFVYVSDARFAKVKVAFAVDSSLHRSILYPAAMLRRSSAGTAASAFISYLGTPKGKALLRQYGFE